MVAPPPIPVPSGTSGEDSTSPVSELTIQLYHQFHKPEAKATLEHQKRDITLTSNENLIKIIKAIDVIVDTANIEAANPDPRFEMITFKRAPGDSLIQKFASTHLQLPAEAYEAFMKVKGDEMVDLLRGMRGNMETPTAKLQSLHEAFMAEVKKMAKEENPTNIHQDDNKYKGDSECQDKGPEMKANSKGAGTSKDTNDLERSNTKQASTESSTNAASGEPRNITTGDLLQLFSLLIMYGLALRLAYVKDFKEGIQRSASS